VSPSCEYGWSCYPGRQNWSLSVVNDVSNNAGIANCQYSRCSSGWFVNTEPPDRPKHWWTDAPLNGVQSDDQWDADHVLISETERPLQRPSTWCTSATWWHCPSPGYWTVGHTYRDGSAWNRQSPSWSSWQQWHWYPSHLGWLSYRNIGQSWHSSPASDRPCVELPVIMGVWD